MKKKTWLSAIGLYLFAQILFLINIQFPRTHNFDEFHYVPSAKQFLAMTENQNWEHPPLGKLIMAAGIGLFGDVPIGWRVMSTVFGALTLVGMFLWGLAVFRNHRSAWVVALITLFNQLLYVQARIGMLDTFMFTFLVGGIASFCAAWNVSLTRAETLRFFRIAGVCFGLATACKWIGVIAWGLALGLVGLVALIRSWGTRFAAEKDDDWYQPGLWKEIRVGDVLIAFGILPLFAYFATFLPYLFVDRVPRYTLHDIWNMQAKMLDGQQRVVNEHPYMSKWTSWPLMTRPIWYAFDKEGPAQEIVRGVLLLGNPLIMWGGLMAVVLCVWDWIRSRSRESFLILMFYFAFVFCWAVIPRKVAFYYYYYPAGMTLSLAIALIFHPRAAANPGAVPVPVPVPEDRTRWIAAGVFIAASVALFVWFFPILAALRIPAEEFRKWMWLDRWV